MRLRRKTKRSVLLLTITSTFIGLTLLRRSSFSKNEKIGRHLIVRRNAELPPSFLGNVFNDDNVPLDALTEDLPGMELEGPPPDVDGEKRLPGTLICEPTPSKRPKAPKSNNNNIPDKPVLVIPNNPVLVGQVGHEKNIGCCPAGDRNGTPYTQGESCCKNIIYNATKDFCCLEKSRVLEINDENERFCYPPNRIPFCRVRDLHLDQRPPLKAQCRNTAGKSKHPNQCTFLCPPGLQVKKDKRIKCNAVGNWDHSDPECCEGCPSTYTQDIWFIVDIDQSIGIGNLSNIRSFIKLLVSYFPVSSDQVQVALTAYNSKLFTNEGTWYLDTYDNHEALERAINMMPMRGSGRKTGEALAWVGENAFEGRLGDRVDVPNTIVLITTGPPDDFTVEEASEVIRGHGRFIVIAAGPDATSSELANIATLPHEVNYFRADYFEELVDRDKKFLYERMCEETCLGRIPDSVGKNPRSNIDLGD